MRSKIKFISELEEAWRKNSSITHIAVPEAKRLTKLRTARNQGVRP